MMRWRRLTGTEAQQVAGGELLVFFFFLSVVRRWYVALLCGGAQEGFQWPNTLILVPFMNSQFIE
jgi:hypothetical protein